MKASLIVVASFGLVAYGAVQWKHSKWLPKTKIPEYLSGPKELNKKGLVEKVSISKPERLVEVDRSARLKKVILANRSHVTLSRSIVVFENGTSVIVKEPSMDPVSDAKVVLAKCYSKQIKFKTHPVEEGGTIVAFETGSVYHWLFPDDAAVVATWPIDEIKDLLMPNEKAVIEEDWNPPLHVRMGLTARKRLSEDVVDLHVIKILRGGKDSGVGQVGAVDYNPN